MGIFDTGTHKNDWILVVMGYTVVGDKGDYTKGVLPTPSTAIEASQIRSSLTTRSMIETT